MFWMLRHAWHSISFSTCHDILCVEFHGVHAMTYFVCNVIMSCGACHDICCVVWHWSIIACNNYTVRGYARSIKKQLGQCGNNKKLCKLRQTKGEVILGEIFLKNFKELYKKYQDTRKKVNNIATLFNSWAKLANKKLKFIVKNPEY